MKLLLYFHTIRHLKPRQVWYQLWYRVRGAVRKFYGHKYRLSQDATGKEIYLQEYIQKPRTLFPGDRFIFLNIDGEFINWDDNRFGALWRYNLNYMDYIIQEGGGFSRGKEWINRFISEFGSNNCGKDPYPTSLRTINWIKFIWKYSADISTGERKLWDSSLYAQYLILLDKLEYNILGNHLLENACSLLWGALYFGDKKLYRKASRLLEWELDEQILADGGHFELSPMYHCIILDRLLDCINISQNNPTFEGQTELTSVMRSKADAMLGWLEAVIYEDGTIPLLNDAAYGIAPSPRELFDYAQRLSIAWEKSELKESGYRKLTGGDIEMVVDVGEIGPSYIPGHAHADTFNFELRISGRPFIVDTGISTYEKNERRAYERSTPAHNTVTVNGQSSSEVWGGFRVANRAHIIGLSEQDGKVAASHNGFRKYGMVHEREWRIKDRQIIINDQVSGSGSSHPVGTLVFHPEVEIISVTTDKVITSHAEIRLWKVEKILCEDAEISRYYNKFERTKSVKLYFYGDMEYEIIPLDK